MLKGYRPFSSRPISECDSTHNPTDWLILIDSWLEPLLYLSIAFKNLPFEISYIISECSNLGLLEDLSMRFYKNRKSTNNNSGFLVFKVSDE